jgi:hypothetical protein
MTKTSIDPKPSYRLEIAVVLGYVLFLVLAVAAGLGQLYFIFPKTTPSYTSEVPFMPKLPDWTPTATPHFVGNTQPGVSLIFKDEFKDNQNLWKNSQDPTSLSVNEGKLTFGSSGTGQIAMVSSATVGSVLAAQNNSPYYLQADFSVDHATAEGFGFFFAGKPSTHDFFLFEFYPESRRYFLYHNSGGAWLRRMAGYSDWIQSFPAAITLGMYVNKGNLEFYINHKLVDTYQDSWESFQAGETGFYVSNSGFQLTITNFFIDGVGGS